MVSGRFGYVTKTIGAPSTPFPPDSAIFPDLFPRPDPRTSEQIYIVLESSRPHPNASGPKPGLGPIGPPFPRFYGFFPICSVQPYLYPSPM